MKVKRHKHVCKQLTFYKNNFNIEPPFNVIVDGTFCKAALKNQLNIREQLPKYLEAEVNIMMTKCIIAECEALGSLLFGPLKILRQYDCIHCGHNPPKKPASCTRAQARKKPRKYFIATQDTDLRDRLRELSGIPLIYISHKAMHLEEPSSASKDRAREKLQVKLQAPQSELERIKALKQATFGEPEVKRKRKRKGPKQPNPLSCKKRKVKNEVPQTQTTNKKSRRRKRKHKLNENI